MPPEALEAIKNVYDLPFIVCFYPELVVRQLAERRAPITTASRFPQKSKPGALFRNGMDCRDHVACRQPQSSILHRRSRHLLFPPDLPSIMLLVLPYPIGELCHNCTEVQACTTKINWS